MDLASNTGGELNSSGLLAQLGQLVQTGTDLYTAVTNKNRPVEVSSPKVGTTTQPTTQPQAGPAWTIWLVAAGGIALLAVLLLVLKK